MINGEEKLLSITKELLEISKKYEINCENIIKTSGERQDILHSIEGTRYSASEGYEVYRTLRDIGERRRMLKYENKSIEPIYKAMTHPESKISELLSGLIAKCEKANSNLDKLKYSPRSNRVGQNTVNENMKCLEKPTHEKIILYKNDRERIKLTSNLKQSYNKIVVDEANKKILCSELKSKPKRISVDKIYPLQIDFEVKKVYECTDDKQSKNIINTTKHKYTEYYYDKPNNKIYCGIKK